MAPENSIYLVRLAEIEPASALALMQRAAELNPLNSSIWIESARIAEEHHDLRQAESSLLHAVRVDNTFAPRWMLTEYYSRRHDEPHFWPAVRAALTTSYDDVSPLFDLCWTFAPEPGVILERAIPDRPEIVRQFFDFLLAKNRLRGADAVVSQLLRLAGPDTVRSLLAYCDRLLASNDAARAVDVWNALATKGLVAYPVLSAAEGHSLTNGRFRQPVLAGGFDWRATPVDEIFVQGSAANGGLRFDFSGKQPETCQLLLEFVPVVPARPYQFAVRYATDGLDGDTGLKWRVLDAVTGADLIPASGWMTGNERRQKEERYGFSTGPETRLVKLALGYQRPAGEVRIEGSLLLEDVSLGFVP